ncbi:hypothetical protein ACFL52_00185 [Candidatus Margulisiibacteriota bacterium]
MLDSVLEDGFSRYFRGLLYAEYFFELCANHGKANEYNPCYLLSSGDIVLKSIKTKESNAHFLSFIKILIEYFGQPVLYSFDRVPAWFKNGLIQLLESDFGLNYSGFCPLFFKKLPDGAKQYAVVRLWSDCYDRKFPRYRATVDFYHIPFRPNGRIVGEIEAIGKRLFLD